MMRAQYESKCNRCRDVIYPGEEITSSGRRWTHANCSDGGGQEQPKWTGRFCPKCQMELPTCGECDCS